MSQDFEPVSSSPSDEVELWRADLDAWDAEVIRWAETILSEDEHARANRFLIPGLRRRFVTGRTALRMVIGEKLSVDPAEIVFSYGPFGKPGLARPVCSDLHFNLTHADRWALIGVSWQGRVGVDLERFQEIVDWEDIASACFTADERQEIASLPLMARSPAFIRRWTQREALLKALGWGWAGPAIKSRAPFAPALSITDIPAPEGYAAALAHSSPALHLIERTWFPSFAESTRPE